MTTATCTRPLPTPSDTPDWLCCRRCGHRLAQHAQPAGAYVNPHGFVHDIVTVLSAPGLRAYGPVTAEFCWFEGYGWQLADCRQCHVHVGWCYLAAGSAQPSMFFGLRRDAIAPPSVPSTTS